jgi:quercetin dioxygenase-like cupin family protein
MKHFILEDMKPLVPAPGVEMRVIHGDKMTMVFFRLQPGTGVPVHAHPHEQMGTVLKGAIELIVGDEKRKVCEGEAYHVPSNVMHGGRCEESLAEIIEVFSPPREDLR